MESVASETVDSTLIVNGTSSSQENTEISATYSWSHSPERDHAAATIQKYYKGFRARRILAVMSEAAAIRIQKHYRGFRTRRNLADSIIAAELLWQTTLSDTQKMGPVPSLDIGRENHIGSLLDWADTRVLKYGNLSRDQLALLHCWETIDPRLRYIQNKHFFYLIWGDQCFSGSWKFDSYTTSLTQNWISELTKVWKTWKGALQRWLEVIDPRHRVGRNLNFYFQIWMTVRSGQPFFYWLDVGDGKTVEHLECSREKLRHERNAYLEQVSKLEAVESLMSLMLRSESNNEKDRNSNQQAINSDVAMYISKYEGSKSHNGPADGFNQKDLLRRIFYAMNLLLEITTAVLDYVSSQQRQPRYALSGMILSITVMAISFIQLAYTGGKEGVSLQRKSWIPWFYHPAPSNKPFGDLVQVVELLFSVSQCVFAIIAYHYLSRDQNNPAQFCIYPIAFAFCLLCLSFIRREPL